MAELLAQGKEPIDFWERVLPTASSVILGRDPDVWSVPWDPWISHRHAELTWRGESLMVRQLPKSRNPMFFRGEQAKSFAIQPGESFVIGTTLFLLRERDDATQAFDDVIVSARTIGAEELEEVPFRDAPDRLDVLNRLPEIISSATNQDELFLHLINMLLTGIRKASAVAIVSLDTTVENGLLTVLHQESRSMAEHVHPSLRLVTEAVLERKATVLHTWNVIMKPGDEEYTQSGNFDWAFCTPVNNDDKEKWGIFVTGQFPVEENKTLMGPWETNILADDLKFTELVSRILRSIHTIKSLEHKQSILGRFFSPEVMHLMATPNPELALKSQETDVTVLFCDLRGFSRKVEEGEGDLFALLERISKALRVMTQNILDYGGVISDFQGDAAMGFWGWPVTQAEKVIKACSAAMGIQTFFDSFSQIPNHPLADFQVGIGLATGRAVAGTIGPENQVKIGVFGPVVNLASRLESMTKQFHVPILIDENTQQILKQAEDFDLARWRRLANVKPYGMTRVFTVYELIPPESERPELAGEHIEAYEQAEELFRTGKWDEAQESLRALTVQDGASAYLQQYINGHEGNPPEGWQGYIPFREK